MPNEIMAEKSCIYFLDVWTFKLLYIMDIFLVFIVLT